jgi:hypothetical protein
MNRSRWISLGFVILFIGVTVGVPAWKERTGQISHKSVDGLYAAFALLCMGLVCVWRADIASGIADGAAADMPDNEPQTESPGSTTAARGRRSMRSVGWLLLVLSIAIAAADLIR